MQILNTVRRGACLALLVALVGSSTAFAQAYAEKDQQWWNMLEAQLVESAQSDIDQVRHEAFQHIIFFAENYDQFVNFDDAAFEIMGRFEASDSVEERLLALAALNAIGEEATISRLMEVADAESSERVRAVAAKVLLNHAAG
ncbi:MAG: hypothetical protein JJ896_02470 [Rhodothermales bacterium]|nr:hypothetical protein [Rhodothermales bacterium]MBO6778495.1 hypothetical protein [Rhodothermales bacterium]